MSSFYWRRVKTFGFLLGSWALLACGKQSPRLTQTPTKKQDERAELAARLADPNGLPITFPEVSRWVLQRACVQCHNSATAEGGVDLSTHAGTIASAEAVWVRPYHPEESPLLEALNTTSEWRQMPPAHSPAIGFLERQLVERWIAQGALPDASSVPNKEPSLAEQIDLHLEADTTPVTYETVRELVFERGRCLECHSEGGRLMDQAAMRFGADLTSYESLGFLNGIVPGRLHDQEVLEADGTVRTLEGSQIFISVQGESPSMPPAADGYRPLIPQQIELLRRWIEQGAPGKQRVPIPLAGPS